MKLLLALLLVVACTSALGQLCVTVAPPKVVGQKAVVSLALTNGLAEKIQSARAAVFLLDEQSKVVSQSTRWIIGDSGTNSLPAGATNAFHFVLVGDRPLASTNLTARVTVTRLVFQAGRLGDVTKDVRVIAPPN